MGIGKSNTQSRSLQQTTQYQLPSTSTNHNLSSKFHIPHNPIFTKAQYQLHNQHTHTSIIRNPTLNHNSYTHA
jgi:hypothetical protein